MGRRKFYARAKNGQFARTAGSKGVYRKKTSTRRKVAYATGAALIVGGAAVGGRELYRAGGRKGYEYGRAQGIKTGAPLRGPKGKFLKDDLKRDSSQNPFARGFRPVGKDGRARKAPKLRTAGDRLRQSTRIAEGISPRPSTRAQRRRNKAAKNASTKIREASIGRSNSRRYNQAQSASQRVRSGAARVRNNVGTAGAQVRSRNAFSVSSGGQVSDRRRKKKR